MRSSVFRIITDVTLVNKKLIPSNTVQDTVLTSPESAVSSIFYSTVTLTLTF